MKALRKVAAVLVWLLATVLMIVSLVLCVTLVLAPLGVPLLLFSLRMYAWGMQLMLPRPQEIRRTVRGSLGLRPRGSLDDDVEAAATTVGRRVEGARKGLRRRLHRRQGRSWFRRR